MMRHFGFSRFALLGVIAVAVLPAAPVEHSLGNGLVYVRVHKLPADLPAKTEGRAPACVLDLRYVDADADAALAFGAWLKFRSAPRSALFILVNGDTSAALLRTLGSPDRGAGVAVIGPASGPFAPDIPVRTLPEEERRAYEAFAKGAAMGTMINDHPGKVRNDEASLAKERGFEPRAPAGGATSAQRPAPIIDAAVQRAVHLHRSLLALKKI